MGLNEENTGRLFMNDKLVLDTSVIVEYIVLRSRYRSKVAKLFNLALAGKIELYVSVVTLSELMYVASRIYQVAGLHDPNGEALDFIEWIKRRCKVVNVNEAIALRAGENRKRLHIALPDCYVIATAEFVKAKPLFRSVEKEMKSIVTELKGIGVRFLEEMEI